MIALLAAKAAGLWTRKQIANNVLAGLVVGIVALPLAMAFAIASGARPEQAYIRRSWQVCSLSDRLIQILEMIKSSMSQHP